jgi:O-methyltransferase
VSWIKRSAAKHIGPFLGAHGWRPARAVPLADGYLNASYGYDDEADIKAAVRRVRSHTMTSFERLATLWQQVRYLDRAAIQGGLVECGTWRGGAVGMMALAHMAGSTPTRTLHLFDSFEGLPRPTSTDGAAASRYAAGRTDGSLDAIGACEGPLDDNRDLLERQLGYPRDLLSYHVGWFQDTLPSAVDGIGPIALLRLDGDWYESTKVCLQALEPLVVPGGIVVIDDYGHWEGCRVAVDEYLEANPPPLLLSHVDYTARYWIKPAGS